MRRLMRDGTAESVSRDQILGHEEREKNMFPRSADHEKDWQSYSIDPYSAISYFHIMYYIQSISISFEASRQRFS